MAKKKTQTALNTFLVAADALARTNNLVEAEIRYRDALKAAERDYGQQSDQAMLVSTILSAFYRAHNRISEAEELEGRLFSWPMSDGSIEPDDGPERKFIGGSKKQSDQEGKQDGYKVPANLRRSCQMLGLPIDVPLTEQTIKDAWKRQMLSKSAHPDLGGNTDEAVMLNKAKEELMNFLAERAPKLGKSLKKDKD